MQKVGNICLSAKNGRIAPSLRGNSPAFYLGTGGRFPNFYFLGDVHGFAGPGFDGPLPGFPGGVPGFPGGVPGLCAIGVHLLSWQNLYVLTDVYLPQG